MISFIVSVCAVPLGYDDRGKHSEVIYEALPVEEALLDALEGQLYDTQTSCQLPDIVLSTRHYTPTIFRYREVIREKYSKTEWTEETEMDSSKEKRRRKTKKNEISRKTKKQNRPEIIPTKNQNSSSECDYGTVSYSRFAHHDGSKRWPRIENVSVHVLQIPEKLFTQFFGPSYFGHHSSKETEQIDEDFLRFKSCGFSLRKIADDFNGEDHLPKIPKYSKLQSMLLQLTSSLYFYLESKAASLLLGVHTKFHKTDF